MSWDEIDYPIKLHDNLFGDEKTEAHLLAIAQQHLILVLLRAQHLEDSLLVILIDACALISNNEDYLLLSFVIGDEDINFSVVCVI